MHLLLNLKPTVGASEVDYQPEFTTMVVNSKGHIQGVHSSQQHSSTMYPLDMTLALEYHGNRECTYYWTWWLQLELVRSTITLSLLPWLSTAKVISRGYIVLLCTPWIWPSLLTTILVESALTVELDGYCWSWWGQLSTRVNYHGSQQLRPYPGGT